MCVSSILRSEREEKKKKNMDIGYRDPGSQFRFWRYIPTGVSKKHKDI